MLAFPLRLPFVVALLAAALVTVTGCSQTIDEEKAEKGVAEYVRSQGAKVKSVTCPGGKEAKKGDRFTCKVTGTDGSVGQVLVTETDDKGDGDIGAILRPAVVRGLVARAVQAQVTNKPVIATCPQILVAKTGRTFRCTVSSPDGSRGQAVLTDKDGKGNVAVDAPFVHTRTAERQMAQTIKRQARVRSATVTCPDIIEGKAGATFDCDVVGDGQKAVVQATQTDGEGGYTFKPKPATGG